MLDKEGALPDLPERPAPAQVGQELGFGVRQPEDLPRLRKLVGWLRVDHFRLRVCEETLRESQLARAFGTGRAQVGQAVQDDDVLRPDCARELERLLEPLADAEVRQDSPAFVDKDDPLRAPLVALRLDHRLQPGGRAGHQDPERGGVRVQDGTQVEDNERRVEVEAPGRRAVEHPAQVPRAELVERESHWAHRDRELVDAHRECVCHFGGRVQQYLDHMRQSWLRGRAIRKYDERLLGAPLLLRCQRPLERGGRDRVEEVQLPLSASARCQRVEANSASGRERDRSDAKRLGERVVFALHVDDPGLAPEDALPEDVRLDQARLRPSHDSDYDRVRARQLATVQLPWVVAERASVDVAADVDAASAEPAFGHERIGGLDVRRRGAVSWLPLRVHRSPRQSGSVYVKASSCWPYRRRSSSRAICAACSISEQLRSSSSGVRAETVTYPAKRTAAWPSASYTSRRDAASDRRRRLAVSTKPNRPRSS